MERTVASYAFLPLAYRAMGLLIATAGLIGSRSLGPIPLRPLVAVLLVAAVANLGLMLAVGRMPRLLKDRRVIAADLAVLVTLSIWAATTMPDGTVFLDNRDPFTVYIQGTVALWTGFGSRTLGLVLVSTLGLPLQFLLATLNGVPLASIDWLTLATRGLWFVAAFLLAEGIVSVVRGGGALLAADRHRVLAGTRSGPRFSKRRDGRHWTRSRRSAAEPARGPPNRRRPCVTSERWRTVKVLGSA